MTTCRCCPAWDVPIHPEVLSPIFRVSWQVPTRRFDAGGSGRLRDPRLARFVLSDNLGVPLGGFSLSYRLEAPARPGLSLCAEYERQLGGGSPLSSLMARRISEAQGCHREMGSEESAEQSRGSMDKNRAPRQASRSVSTRSECMKLTKRVRPRHPEIERVMQEQVRQDRPHSSRGIVYP